MSYREGIEVAESRYMLPDFDADEFRTSIVLMSIGPEDCDWLDEHCDGDWRKHVSSLRVEARKMLPAMDQILAGNPIELIQISRGMLVRQLAEEIIDRMEPLMSRYKHGRQVPL